MNIAIVSHEYPHNEIPYGGIGTYSKLLAEGLAFSGHYVEVFCCSLIESGHFYLKNNLRINKILITPGEISRFKEIVLVEFITRNSEICFDIIESAEYNVDAYEIKKEFPQIPLVIKLHTPTYVINSYSNITIRRFLLKQLLGDAWIFVKKIVSASDIYNRREDIEYQFTKLADVVCSPSRLLEKEVRKTWHLTAVELIPNFFIPSKAYLEIQPKQRSEEFVITYLGTINIRKGFDVFLKIIPRIVRTKPNTLFKFIGKTYFIDKYNNTPQNYIKDQLGEYSRNVLFIDSVPLEEVPLILAETDICLFPALWDNFPYVCLEAMSAGKVVVASKNSGMAEVIDDGVSGFLVNPLNSRKIVDTIIRIIDDEKLQRVIEVEARKVVTNKYDYKSIVPVIEKIYKRAISKI